MHLHWIEDEKHTEKILVENTKAVVETEDQYATNNYINEGTVFSVTWQCMFFLCIWSDKQSRIFKGMGAGNITKLVRMTQGKLLSVVYEHESDKTIDWGANQGESLLPHFITEY